jgi:hypothetical protein
MSEFALMSWLSALSVEKRTLNGKMFPDDQCSHNKLKKARNYADSLTNGYDDYTSFSRT